jgi:hypothetical protein
MKIRLTIFLLLLFSANMKAPTDTRLTIAEGVRIHYDPMLYSFMAVESNFDTDTVNSLGYGGILQIGSEMIAECNRILGLKGSHLKYVLEDRLDSTKSVEIWYLIQDWHNKKYNLQRACKIWNPKADKRYYQRILKHLK